MTREELDMGTQYNSLEELRARKSLVSRRIGRGIENLRSEVNSGFMPSGLFSRQTSGAAGKVLKIVGYGITIYKTWMSVRGVVKFFSKRFR